MSKISQWRLMWNRNSTICLKNVSKMCMTAFNSYYVSNLGYEFYMTRIHSHSLVNNPLMEISLSTAIPITPMILKLAVAKVPNRPIFFLAAIIDVIFRLNEFSLTFQDIWYKDSQRRVKKTAVRLDTEQIYNYIFSAEVGNEIRRASSEVRHTWKHTHTVIYVYIKTRKKKYWK